MSKESEKLFDGITNVSDELVESVQATRKTKHRLPRWVYPVAAVLAVVIVGGVFFRGESSAYAIAEAEYPTERVFTDPEEYTGAVSAFLQKSIPQFLAGDETKNRLYAPLNVYIALGMLAEVTDGESRAQILDLLGAEDIEEQRALTKSVWNANYDDSERGKCVLANSLWLNEDVRFVQKTMDSLAKHYYASSYRGKMGSGALNSAMINWIDTQTGGLLKDSSSGIALDPETVMALVSTVYFRGAWASEFSEKDTSDGTFHAPSGDLTCGFMHKDEKSGRYFWGERFSAVSLGFTNGREMWFFLPDEGVTPDELLTDADFLVLLTAGRAETEEWEKSVHALLNLAVPKFDADDNVDLKSGLKALGVTDVMDPAVSDFTPMTTDTDVFLSAAKEAVRVTIDEEGCTAASYVVIVTDTTGGDVPPDEVVDFILDRPFLFAVTAPDGLPIFTGVIEDPTA